MKIKYLIAALVAAVMLGCSSGSDAKVAVEQESAICTFKGDVNSFGGEIEVKCTTTPSAYPDFLIIHQIDGVGYNTLFPTTFITGNLLYINDVVYIPANSSDDFVMNTLTVVRVDNAIPFVIGDTEFEQGTFEDNIDIIVNVENTNVIDINNTVILGTDNNSTDDNVTGI